MRTSIERIAALDPGSTSFRYPETKEGEVSTQAVAINLDVVAAEVMGVMDALNAEWRWAMSEGQEQRDEAAREAADEWLAGLSDEERDAYLEEEEEIWNAWMREAWKD